MLEGSFGARRPSRLPPPSSRTSPPSTEIIVLATGYTSQRETVRRVISEDVANRIGPCWGKDAQGEIPGVWRNSGVPRFMIASVNLFQSRCYSKHTAMLIQLQELGLVKDPVYPDHKKLVDPRF
ncbi:hypothetical protein BCR35DRAFT_344639 [Leucosporidium creatinivorum]|uniref:Uncharacterized protein n=1 Tax=Leucosporidium creatinivorum TaxID=106004 RepID=A0A1Y2EMV3_9BASI|nr:hypothetical protein BCR35DRAFT_344639 [Leucosporidium creatinivorum]